MCENAIRDKECVLVIVDRQKPIISPQCKEKQETKLKGDFVALSHLLNTIGATYYCDPRIIS